MSRALRRVSLAAAALFVLVGGQAAGLAGATPADEGERKSKRRTIPVTWVKPDQRTMHIVVNNSRPSTGVTTIIIQRPSTDASVPPIRNASPSGTIQIESRPASPEAGSVSISSEPQRLRGVQAYLSGGTVEQAPTPDLTGGFGTSSSPHSVAATVAQDKILRPTPIRVGSTGSSMLANTDGYRLGPGDVIDIFVWRNPDLSRQVPVRPDGRISLPLVGEMVATGKTADQLQEEIATILSDFIQMPTVTVAVTEVHSLVVYVLGNVGSPGPLELARNITVLQAIAMAGGLNEFADKNDITILRTVNGRQQRIAFRYDDVVKGKGQGPETILRAGDVIYVP